MNWRRALDMLLAGAAALFVLAMAFVIVRAVSGDEPVARILTPAATSSPAQFGPPVLAIPRGGVRTVVITTRRPNTPLALKMRLSSEDAATFSARARGTLRASRPEVVLRGQQLTIPLGRSGAPRIAVEIYTRAVPEAPGPPIVLEEVRVAWDSSPSIATQVVVWSMLITGPLFLMLLIVRFATGPRPGPSGG